MEVTLFELADHASQDERGKLSINGIFDTLGVASFPAVHQQLHLVVRFRAGYTDSGEAYHARVVAERPDGSKLLSLESGIEVSDIAPGEYSHSNIVFRVQNAQFEESGVYMFRIYIDGEVERELPLQVKKRE